MRGCETFLPVRAGRQTSESYRESEVRDLCNCSNERRRAGEESVELHGGPPLSMWSEDCEPQEWRSENVANDNQLAFLASCI